MTFSAPNININYIKNYMIEGMYASNKYVYVTEGWLGHTLHKPKFMQLIYRGHYFKLTCRAVCSFTQYDNFIKKYIQANSTVYHTNFHDRMHDHWELNHADIFVYWYNIIVHSCEWNYI